VRTAPWTIPQQNVIRAIREWIVEMYELPNSSDWRPETHRERPDTPSAEAYASGRFSNAATVTTAFNGFPRAIYAALVGRPWTPRDDLQRGSAEEESAILAEADPQRRALIREAVIADLVKDLALNGATTDADDPEGSGASSVALHVQHLVEAVGPSAPLSLGLAETRRALQQLDDGCRTVHEAAHAILLAVRRESA
jgi:hypothetical protein